MKPRLLVFETRMLGDTVLSIPFVRAASAVCEVFMCCQPESAAIAALVLGDSHIIPWRPSWMDAGSGRHWFDSNDRAVIRRAQSMKFDATVSVWADVRVHLAMALTGAVRRVGLPMNSLNFYATHLAWRRRQLLLGSLFAGLVACSRLKPLLTAKIDRRSPSQHHLDTWRQLAEAMGFGEFWKQTAPWFDPGELQPGHILLSFVRRARQIGRPLWVIHSGGRQAVKRWPVSNFAAVIKESLVPAGAFIAIIHPPDASHPDVYDENIHHYTPADFVDFIRVIAAADCVLCNDSVAAHLAAALGKRAVVVMGPASPDWFAPWGHQHRVIHSSGDCPYHPCLDVCAMPSIICLEAVDAARVNEAVCDLLSDASCSASSTL